MTTNQLRSVVRFDMFLSPSISYSYCWAILMLMDVRIGGYMFNFFQKTQGWEVSILIFQVSAIWCIKNECAFRYDGVHDHHLVDMLPSVCAGKNMLPRIVRSPIQWPVVVQKKVLWCLKVCTDFFIYLYFINQLS